MTVQELIEVLSKETKESEVFLENSINEDLESIETIENLDIVIDVINDIKQTERIVILQAAPKIKNDKTC